MHTVALIYVAVLCGIIAIGLRSLRLGLLRGSLAAFVLVWAIWIAASHILSLFAAMNVTWLFLNLSILLALATSFGFRMLAPARELYFAEFETPFSPRLTVWVAIFLVLSTAFVVVANLMLAKAFLPANPDSIVYRFPRVYWYFSEGSLAHFSNQGEPRPQFYPFNGTIAYLPLLHFQLGPRSFSLMSLSCWFTSGVAAYVFARDLGGPRVVAAATAWLIFLTPNVLIQSLSTNDELIAAAPMLVGIFFLHRWYHGRQPFDAVIGVIGVAISAGTKLHVTFYIFLLAALAVVLAFHCRAVVKEVRSWLTWRGVIFIASLGAIAAIFSFSFMVYNYRASGQTMAWDLAAQLQNKPFSIAAALQNAVLYSAQIVLTPIADLHVGSAYDSTRRGLHYQAFNDLVAPLFTWVDNGPAFTSASYRFTGLNSSQAILLNEQTVFIGFTWLIALMAAVWLAYRWNDPRALWARFQIASLPLWLITFAALTRYIEGVSVYLSYATILAAPAFVYAFAPVKHLMARQLRLGLLAFVGFTHVFFAASILFTSPAKNLSVLARTTERPLSRGFVVDQAVTDEIGRAKNGVEEHAIAWGQPYWALMAYHPEIKQALASQPIPIPAPADELDDEVTAKLRYSRYVLTPPQGASALHVYTFPQFPAYGHAAPLRIPDLQSAGLTWIGDLMFALGPEWVFAAGNDVEKRFPYRDKYIVLPYSELSNFGRNSEPTIRISPSIYGLGSKDNLKFRFEIRIDGKVVSHSDWQGAPEVDLETPGLKPGNGVLTMYVRNDAAGGTIYSVDAALQSTKPLQLPAGDTRK